MKTIKNYNEFILENGKYDNYAYQFIYDKITEQEFTNYIFSDLVNEGIIDNIKKVYNDIKEKLLDAFFTFIVEAKNVGVKIISKVISIAGKWIAWLKKFYEKHPTLTKVIVIFIIIVILMILSSGSAQASEITSHGDKFHLSASHTESCNAAIHFIDVNHDDLQKMTGADDKTLFQAKVYIKDMIDGKLDSPEMVTKQAKAIGETAMKTINELISKANDSNDAGLMKKIVNLIGEGSKHVWGGNTKL